jgi:transposase InsO family protein
LGQTPNQRWVGDTTELLVGPHGAKLYLVVVLDLFSRFVIGRSLSAVNDRHLTIKALDVALRRRECLPFCTPAKRTVALADCLKDAGDSSLFLFTSQRVSLK